MRRTVQSCNVLQLWETMWGCGVPCAEETTCLRLGGMGSKWKGLEMTTERKKHHLRGTAKTCEKMAAARMLKTSSYSPDTKDDFPEVGTQPYLPSGWHPAADVSDSVALQSWYVWREGCATSELW